MCVCVFVFRALWMMSPWTTPRALWEAIMLGSDYKALLINTHTHTHRYTHTPWSLSLITLDEKEEEEEEKSIFQQEYF